MIDATRETPTLVEVETFGTTRSPRYIGTAAGIPLGLHYAREGSVYATFLRNPDGTLSVN